MIYIDNHEPTNISTKLKHLGAAVDIKHLPIGDYWIGDELVIERKTIDDFFNSITQNRYYPQLYNMMKNTKKPLVYIIGIYPKRPPLRKVGSKFISIDIEKALRTHKIISYYSFRVPVIQVGTEDEFIKDLLEFHNKSGKNTPGLKPIQVKRKASSIEDIRTDIYGAIPGLGRKAANHLGKNYPLLKVFSMTEEELSNIKIGNRRLGKRAEKLYEVFSN